MSDPISNDLDLRAQYDALVKLLPAPVPNPPVPNPPHLFPEEGVLIFDDFSLIREPPPMGVIERITREP